MSLQGPIVAVSTDSQRAFAATLDAAKLFPIIDTTWADASRAVAQLHPAAVLVAMSEQAEGDSEEPGAANRRAATLSSADRDRSRAIAAR